MLSPDSNLMLKADVWHNFIEKLQGFFPFGGCPIRNKYNPTVCWLQDLINTGCYWNSEGAWYSKISKDGELASLQQIDATPLLQVFLWMCFRSLGAILPKAIASLDINMNIHMQIRKKKALAGPNVTFQKGSLVEQNPLSGSSISRVWWIVWHKSSLRLIGRMLNFHNQRWFPELPESKCDFSMAHFIDFLGISIKKTAYIISHMILPNHEYHDDFPPELPCQEFLENRMCVALGGRIAAPWLREFWSGYTPWN